MTAATANRKYIHVRTIKNTHMTLPLKLNKPALNYIKPAALCGKIYEIHRTYSGLISNKPAAKYINPADETISPAERCVSQGRSSRKSLKISPARV